jgi:hypothetical protein
VKHGWTLTASPRMMPQRCAVFPHVRTGNYIDTGMTISGFDPHVYVSDVAAQELGRFVGMVPGGDLRRAEAELQLEQAKTEILQERIAELERFKAAVELVRVEVNA